MLQIKFDNISFSTTIINTYSCSSSAPKSHLKSATGFYYTIDDEIYLLTNRHVVIDEEREYYPDSISIRVHTGRDNIEDNEEIMIKLYEENTPVWYEFMVIDLPIDVIALQITQYLDYEKHVFFPFQEKNLLPKTRTVNLGEDCLIIGYPIGFYDQKNNLPIVKRGAISSTFGIPFNDEPHFLIDAVLQPGTSGSPVLVHHKITISSDREQTAIPYRLCGIYSGEYVPDGVPAGLNIVWYIDPVIEMLKNDEWE